MHKKKTPKKTKKLSTSVQAKRLNPRIFIGLILIGCGLLLFNHYQKIQNAKKEAFVATNKTASNEPIKASDKLDIPRNTKDPLVRLLVPQRDIDVSIVEAEIINGYWELSETSASHGLGSAYPGMKGNTVVFAHAREKLFLNLKEVRVGDEILVFSKNKWFKYKIEILKDVYPNEVEVILPTSDERLTLFTCSGFADEKRLIVVAKPIK